VDWQKKYEVLPAFDWSGASYLNGSQSPQKTEIPAPAAERASSPKRKRSVSPAKQSTSEKNDYERHMAEQEAKRLRRLEGLS
jgi:hypothetical protein